jgi:predicted nucleic acid-binding protein
MAGRQGLGVVGTVGIVVKARAEGLVDKLQPLLDRLIARGFYLDPSGQVSQDALRRVGEP